VATDCLLANVNLLLLRDGLVVQTIDGIILNPFRNQEYVTLFDGGNLFETTHSFSVEAEFERISGSANCTVTFDGLASFAEFRGN
jgi:hypothetical protein